ncbi:hypothetical protein [Streptomyces sp. WMMC940]|uniref:hypothetical protein n=1 Tax=Streptomyces sp. WMMC940 TaxID=3015153 RepID=UPI0022B74C58|nr:hypothetical protein [Streptomyces sp. WMMC940]MCZ7456521.1 hypothetical protein [Streptomyces sp. WMMC940]
MAITTLLLRLTASRAPSARTPTAPYRTEFTMLKGTVILAVQHLRTTPDVAGTGRHRGRRAVERLGFLGLPGRGRHRREHATDLRANAARC